MAQTRKSIITLALAASIAMGLSSAQAQSYTFDYHPAYGPPPMGSSPKSIARLLSYENFRSIKLLNAAIMNFGGGEAEIDRLIDQYAEASALYFQNKMTEAAKAFKENQTAIMAVAKQLADKYHKDTTALLTDSIKLNTRAKLKLNLQSRREPLPSDKFLEYAQAGVLKATDYYERFKDAKAVSALELINAIYYYRIAKDNMFQMMRVLADSEAKIQAENEVKAMLAQRLIEPAQKEEVRKEKELQKRNELIAKYLDKFSRDMVDNKNLVYQSKEKDK